MQQPEQSIKDTYHAVLSMPAESTYKLQVGLPDLVVDPLALLNSTETLPQDSLLNLVLEAHSHPPAKVLGSECRLSRCQLWQMQEEYYANVGLDAWQHSVPNYVTSSAYIAEAYADMVIAFLDDMRGSLNWDEPFYVVEMAAGTGRFSYLMIRELKRKLQRLSAYQHLKLRYVMTDFTETGIQHWEAHTELRADIESGLLDFAVWNPLQEQQFTLYKSGALLDKDSVANPVVAIANYFFDSIHQDVFRIEKGRLLEGLVTLERQLTKETLNAPLHLSQIKPKFRYEHISRPDYYPDPSLNRILEFYRNNIPEGSILFPIGAFDAVRNAEIMANGRLMLLSSDKAYTDYLYMTYFYEHEYAMHDGAFSYMVNYDAVSRYFTDKRGVALQTQQKSLSLQTVCCLSMNDVSFERLTYVFEERINRYHPYTSLCALLPSDDGDETRSEIQRFNQLLAQLRLHLAEPKLFALLGQKLADLVHHATFGQKSDLMALMDEARAQYYAAPGESNVHYWLSQLYYHLYRFEDSVSCLEQAIQDFGAHESLYYLQGQAYEKLNRWEDARQVYENALALNPGLTIAEQCLRQVKERLQAS